MLQLPTNASQPCRLAFGFSSRAPGFFSVAKVDVTDRMTGNKEARTLVLVALMLATIR